MAYRNVLISAPASLSVSNKQLIIHSDSQYSVPIEDIHSVMLENRQSRISAYALSELAENGTVVYLCNDQHTPCGVILPFCTHSRHTKIINSQLSQSKPYLKRLWQQIIVTKIENQAKCLQMLGIGQTAQKLNTLSKTVTSGDVKNVEGSAAAIYFRALFGKGFNRNKDCIINAALNYGYSVLRGAVARNVCVYGFEPSLGIHHFSELNSFNLADDLLEPFRPFVDCYVALNIAAKEAELSKAHKWELYNLLNYSALSASESHSMQYAIERTVMSLSRCYSNKKGELVLPVLSELKLHKYE